MRFIGLLLIIIFCIDIASASLSLDSANFYSISSNSDLLIITSMSENGSYSVPIITPSGGGGVSYFNDSNILSLPAKKVKNNHVNIQNNIIYAVLGVIILSSIYIFIFFRRKKEVVDDE